MIHPVSRYGSLSAPPGTYHNEPDWLITNPKRSGARKAAQTAASPPRLASPTPLSVARLGLACDYGRSGSELAQSQSGESFGRELGSRLFMTQTLTRRLAPH